MKSLFVLPLSTLLFAACSQKIIEVEEIIPEPTRVKSLVIGDPLDCGLLNQLMFPIGTSYRPEVIEKPKDLSGGVLSGTTKTTDMNFCLNTTGTLWDSNASLEYINNNDGDFDITNILFFDISTGESYPLVGEKDTLHILSFAIHKEFENPLIFYRVVKEDYNCDSAFNSLDPVTLYV